MLNKSYNAILDEHLHVLIAQGNHEAYIKLKKRYIRHSLRLCKETLSLYSDTGVSLGDLTAVCSDCFVLAVTKFDPSLSSFYSFWKKITKHHVMQYLLNNSYLADACLFKGSFSLDQEFEDSNLYAEVLCEKDEDKYEQKLIADVRRVISVNSIFFTKKEAVILSLVLEGYSIAELEHSGVLSKSKLYLTFNNAVKKLQQLVIKERNKW